MREPVTAFVGIGANLGDPLRAVRDALVALACLPHSTLTATSSLYRTAPHDADGPDYVNAVAQVSTTLGAIELLDALQALETQAGRQRPYPNAPRTLDLDLLLYGDEQLSTPRLVVPHPRMRERAFVLFPLSEIAPELVSAEDLVAVAGQRMVRIA